jgi:hypothetical protein
MKRKTVSVKVGPSLVKMIRLKVPEGEQPRVMALYPKYNEVVVGTFGVGGSGNVVSYRFDREPVMSAIELRESGYVMVCKFKEKKRKGVGCAENESEQS